MFPPACPERASLLNLYHSLPSSESAAWYSLASSMVSTTNVCKIQEKRPAHRGQHFARKWHDQGRCAPFPVSCTDYYRRTSYLPTQLHTRRPLCISYDNRVEIIWRAGAEPMPTRMRLSRRLTKALKSSRVKPNVRLGAQYVGQNVPDGPSRSRT